MIIPVRCFTCGKVVSSAFESYRQRVEMGESPKDVLDSLGIDKYCCRRMMIAHTDLIDDIKPYG